MSAGLCGVQVVLAPLGTSVLPASKVTLDSLDFKVLLEASDKLDLLVRSVLLVQWDPRVRKVHPDLGDHLDHKDSLERVDPKVNRAGRATAGRMGSQVRKVSRGNRAPRVNREQLERLDRLEQPVHLVSPEIPEIKDHLDRRETLDHLAHSPGLLDRKVISSIHGSLFRCSSISNFKVKIIDKYLIGWSLYTCFMLPYAIPHSLVFFKYLF